MNSKYEHYSIVIQWSDEDNLYIASAPELPGCKTHGKTYMEAIRQARDAIESWVDADLAGGHLAPAPKILVKV